MAGEGEVALFATLQGVQAVEQGFDRMAKSFERMNTRIKAAEFRAKKAAEGVKKLKTEVTGAGQKVAEADKKMKMFEGTMQSFYRTLLRIVWVTGFYFIARGLQRMTSSAVEVRAEFELAQLSLQSFGLSAEEASRTFEHFLTLAAKTPLEVQDIMQAAIQMRVWKLASFDTAKGIEEMTDKVRLLATVARVTQVPVQQMIDTLGRLSMGVFRTREVAAVRLDVAALRQTMAEGGDVVAAALDQWRQTFGTLTDSIDQALQTQISNIADAWTRFLYRMGEAIEPALRVGIEWLIGPDGTSGVLGALRDLVVKNKARIEEWAYTMSTTFVGAMHAAGSVTRSLNGHIEQLDRYIQHFTGNILNLNRAVILLIAYLGIVGLQAVVIAVGKQMTIWAGIMLTKVLPAINAITLGTAAVILTIYELIGAIQELKYARMKEAESYELQVDTVRKAENELLKLKGKQLELAKARMRAAEEGYPGEIPPVKMTEFYLAAMKAAVSPAQYQEILSRVYGTRYPGIIKPAVPPAPELPGAGGAGAAAKAAEEWLGFTRDVLKGMEEVGSITEQWVKYFEEEAKAQEAAYQARVNALTVEMKLTDETLEWADAVVRATEMLSESVGALDKATTEIFQPFAETMVDLVSEAREQWRAKYGFLVPLSGFGEAPEPEAPEKVLTEAQQFVKNLHDTLAAGIQVLGASVLTGNIASAIEQTFNTLAQIIATRITTMLGVGGIKGALIAGGVMAVIGLVGRAFGIGKRQNVQDVRVVNPYLNVRNMRDQLEFMLPTRLAIGGYLRSVEINQLAISVNAADTARETSQKVASVLEDELRRSPWWSQ